MLELAIKTARNIKLSEENLRQFLNETFSKVAQKYGLNGTQYQRRAIYMGDAFEACFEVIMRHFYPEIEVQHDVELPKACLIRRGSADFVIYRRNISEGEWDLVGVIEAKGSADHLIGRDGKTIKINRPGMRRTDTVKKAICNAYQVSRAYPDALFFIVTSHKPLGGNARCMCELAEGDIVDKIVDVTVKEELDEMVDLIKCKIQREPINA